MAVFYPVFWVESIIRANGIVRRMKMLGKQSLSGKHAPGLAGETRHHASLTGQDSPSGRAKHHHAEGFSRRKGACEHGHGRPVTAVTE